MVKNDCDFYVLVYEISIGKHDSRSEGSQDQDTVEEEKAGVEDEVQGLVVDGGDKIVRQYNEFGQTAADPTIPSNLFPLILRGHLLLQLYHIITNTTLSFTFHPVVWVFAYVLCIPWLHCDKHHDRIIRIYVGITH